MEFRSSKYSIRGVAHLVSGLSGDESSIRSLYGTG